MATTMSRQPNREDLRGLMDFARRLALRAGEIQRTQLGHVGDVEYKETDEMVTRVDRLCESVIVGGISERFPHHNIVAEENEYPQTDHAYRWYVDPLDGTTNYVHGYRHFSVSIALEFEGEMVLGLVYDPMHDEIFSGTQNGGAFLNGRRISVSGTGRLDRSLLATGFPYDARRGQPNNMENFNRFSLASQAVRVDGSAALNLCYVAVGRFDGFWEMKLRPWDMAGGGLIVREAGGRVSNFQNGRFRIDSGEVLSTNGLIHDQMVSILREAEIRGGTRDQRE
jgi:myo-inositol-1(or 4)-monophosphatase